MTMDRTGRLEMQCEGRASLPAGSATPTKRAAGRGAVQLGPSGAAPAFCAPPRYPDPGTVDHGPLQGLHLVFHLWATNNGRSPI
jgi:hypothetical protein